MPGITVQRRRPTGTRRIYRSTFIVAAMMVATLGTANVAMADATDLVRVLPDTLKWNTPPGIPGLQAAWVLGAEAETGPYLLRVQLTAGARIAPHTHPDERQTTVLSGTVFVGTGMTFKEDRVTAMPAGSVYVIPAGVSHFIWAKDGAVEYQEAGVGPTATKFPASQ